jgi:hypothetical protein
MEEGSLDDSAARSIAVERYRLDVERTAKRYL